MDLGVCHCKHAVTYLTHPHKWPTGFPTSAFQEIAFVTDLSNQIHWQKKLQDTELPAWLPTERTLQLHMKGRVWLYIDITGSICVNTWMDLHKLHYIYLNTILIWSYF